VAAVFISMAIEQRIWFAGAFFVLLFGVGVWFV
jgi:hypothetical protein